MLLQIAQSDYDSPLQMAELFLSLELLHKDGQLGKTLRSQMSVHQEKLPQSRWDYCTIKWMGEQNTASCLQHTRWNFKTTL